MFPDARGLYDPKHEHDACGVGFVAHIKGKKSHALIGQGLTILRNLTHRGAVGADPKASDGAGILVQLPDELFREDMTKQGVKLPPFGQYGVGMVFLPREPASRLACEYEIERAIKDEGQVLLGWRDVPVDGSDLGESVRQVEPTIRQVFVGRGKGVTVTDALERKLYIIRKSAAHAIQALDLAHGKEYYVPSMSARTIVYKGMLLPHQVGEYYLDLKDPRMESALALVHQRFSTNTFPSWDLSHPFRMIAHNGEINTLRGNVNWIRARQGAISSPILGNDLGKIWPLIYDGQSDSASFDNALELLVMAGYSVAHAMMMMIPEAWENHALMDPSRRAFYEYHAAMMEPWDGPASIAFTDGRQIGATLDRNGLRPSRYVVTDDNLVIMASEVGVLPVPEEHIVKKWRLQPGKMFLVDLERGRIIDDKELKESLASAKPYAEWIERIRIKLDAFACTEGKARPCARQSAGSPAGVRLYARGSQVPDDPHGRARARADRLDGQRFSACRAVEQEQEPLSVLQAVVCTSHESADRPDPGRAGDVAGIVHRTQAEPSRDRRDESAAATRGLPAGTRLRADGDHPPHRELHRRQVQILRDRHHLSAGLGQGGDRGAPRVPACASRGCGSRRHVRSSSCPTAA